MEKILLKATKREVQGKKVKKLRKSGFLPIVIYGHERKSEPLQVSIDDFKKVYAKASGSSLVTLMIGSKEESVLIHDVDVDPVNGNYRHADFYKVKLTEKIKTKVPLAFEGVSGAVKEQEGVLVKNLDEIEVECLPTDIPKQITVDISVLKTFEDVIKVKDLRIPRGVALTIEDKEEVLATVTPPRSEEELKALEEEVVEDVESVEGVVKEEKEEEAVEEGAEGEGEKGKKVEEKSEAKETKKEGPEKAEKGEKRRDIGRAGPKV